MSKEPQTPDFHIPTLAVAGVGLIGGSLSMALRRGGHVGRIIGSGSSNETLRRAQRMGVIDEVNESLHGAAKAADVIVLAAPVGSTEYLMRHIGPAMTDDKVITDVGSVKNWVCLAAKTALGAHARRFVAGHPVAGREHSGVRAAHAELFDGQNVALTPAVDTDPDAVELVRAMWRAAGAARVIPMRPAVHDRVLGLTSHLPHIVAYAMVDAFAEAVAEAESDGVDHDPDVGVDGPPPELYGDMAAGGFYDITRTASSDPHMWRDICVTNRQNILRQLDEFGVSLERLRDLIANGESAHLERIFADARETRAQVGEHRPMPPRPTLLFSRKSPKASDSPGSSGSSDSPESPESPDSPKSS